MNEVEIRVIPFPQRLITDCPQFGSASWIRGLGPIGSPVGNQGRAHEEAGSAGQEALPAEWGGKRKSIKPPEATPRQDWQQLTELSGSRSGGTVYDPNSPGRSLAWSHSQWTLQ